VATSHGRLSLVSFLMPAGLNSDGTTPSRCKAADTNAAASAVLSLGASGSALSPRKFGCKLAINSRSSSGERHLWYRRGKDLHWLERAGCDAGVTSLMRTTRAPARMAHGNVASVHKSITAPTNCNSILTCNPTAQRSHPRV
jgi:hypothetical protein